MERRRFPKWIGERLLGVFDELIAALIIALLGYLAWLFQGTLPTFVSNPTILSIIAVIVVVVLVIVSVTVWLKRKQLVRMSGILVVHDDSAAILERAGRISRIVRAGITTLQPYERVRTAVDLRPQRAALNIKNVLTKDLVSLNIELTAIYQIVQTPDAILKATCSVDDWRKATESAIASVLRDVISEQGLRQGKKVAIPSRESIRQLLTQQLNTVTSQWGVQVTTLMIGAIELPET